MTLSVNNLRKSYGKRYVVKDVNLEVSSGEIVGLLGPNGAGKTTTFYMIVGLIDPESGDILMDSSSIKQLPIHKRAKAGIGYLPQEPSIFRKLSVRDNIYAVLEIAGVGDKKTISTMVEDVIDEFNLRGFADRDGYRLSGGERRRTEIARAIALKPKFMLFDEPFAGIDPIAINDLKRVMSYLASKGIGIIITDHNVRDTLSITDRAYIINDGQVLAHGSPSDIVNNADVRDTYLGKDFRL
ncbi:MAG: LPS export ABC transporter ATP-binding protein [Thermodesulfovibrionales bacterium]|nr:LPS export ABC transporter ATP-binding protein [Thermodesulfovibrionales bacterium]